MPKSAARATTPEEDATELLYIQHTNLAKIRVMKDVMRSLMPGDESHGATNKEALDFARMLELWEARLEKRIL